MEARLDISGYSPQDARVFGYLSERLLDVWLTHHEIPYVEAPVLNMESQHWPQKILRFLGRKLRGRKP